jgi:1-phosphofructokinase family hexose kinase
MRIKLIEIITVTANTALDEVLLAQQTQQIKLTFDTSRRLLFPSGKGVNVARAIACLGHPVSAIGMVGKDALATFEKGLASDKLRPLLLATNAATRMNTTLCDVGNRKVTHIRRQALSVSAKEFGRFAAKVRRVVTPGNVVVFGGTLPRGIGAHRFTELIEECRKSGALTIVDSSGTGLVAALVAKPFMVKPNVEELSELIGRPLDSRDTASLIDAMKVVSAAGVRLIVLSRGSRGVLVRFDDQVLTARVKLDQRPAETGAIGSGDAMVAGFAVGLAENLKMVDVIRLGVACGAANVLSLGPGVLKRSDVRRLSVHVNVREYKTR